MKLVYLREFCKISEGSSFIKAAEELSCTQANLSKHIKALESEFNVSFFIRTGRGTVLNEYGMVLQKYAGQICDLMDQFKVVASEMENSEN